MWKQQQEVKHSPHAKPTLQHNLFGIVHKHVQGSLFLVNLAFDRVLLERTSIDRQTADQDQADQNKMQLTVETTLQHFDEIPGQ